MKYPGSAITHGVAGCASPSLSGRSSSTKLFPNAGLSGGRPVPSPAAATPGSFRISFARRSHASLTPALSASA